MQKEQKQILAEAIHHTSAKALLLLPVLDYVESKLPSSLGYAQAANKVGVDSAIVPVVVSCLTSGHAEIQSYIKKFGGGTQSFSGRAMSSEAKTELADAILDGVRLPDFSMDPGFQDLKRQMGAEDGSRQIAQPASARGVTRDSDLHAIVTACRIAPSAGIEDFVNAFKSPAQSRGGR